MCSTSSALLGLALAAALAPACASPPGPKVLPTSGEVWPAPLNEQKLSTYYSYDPNVFKIVRKGKTCNLLESAIQRYLDVLRSQHALMLRLRDKAAGVGAGVGERSGARGARGADYQGHIQVLEVDLRDLCEEYPHADMDEAYGLKVAQQSMLITDSVWGALRGLETFAQLFYVTSDYQDYVVNDSLISDYPRYSHRGLLLDTARHYLPLSDLELVLDALAIHKMNVLHWHLVDDQSFPYVSQEFPELSGLGAFAPWMVYSAADIRHVVQYARARGVRVIAELDVPGHTMSWGVSHPELLARCGAGGAARRGPLHPLLPTVYSTLAALLAELQALFPDKAFHLGGDEVDLACWERNPELQEYMREHGLHSARELHALFMQHALRLLAPDSAPVVWQEVFDDGVLLSNKTIVQVWKSSNNSDWAKEMLDIIKSGQRVVFSSAWYLDALGLSWQAMYAVDPRRLVAGAQMAWGAPGAFAAAERVLGGEACMWGEMVDSANIMTRIWPRASAVAEVLWSPGSPPGGAHGAARRLEEHACRLRRRGVPAEPPNGPGFCAID